MSIRCVTTQNSVYEINDDDKLIRQISGITYPTPRQGEDGQWRSFTSIVPCANGMLIIWSEEKCTLTSPISKG